MSLDLVGHVGLLAGALLILLGAVGVVTFPDALTRVHALSMASTAGATLSLAGVAVAMGGVAEVTSIIFAAGLQAATNPVASTLLAQATYYAEGIATRVDALDELAARSPQEPAPRPDGAAPGPPDRDGAASSPPGRDG